MNTLFLVPFYHRYLGTNNYHYKTLLVVSNSVDDCREVARNYFSENSLTAKILGIYTLDLDSRFTKKEYSAEENTFSFTPRTARYIEGKVVHIFKGTYNPNRKYIKYT